MGTGKFTRKVSRAGKKYLRSRSTKEPEYKRAMRRVKHNKK